MLSQENTKKKDFNMPEFKWYGITLNGNFVAGKQYSLSTLELETMLGKKAIMLFKAYPLQPFFSKKIPLQTKIMLYKNISLLLEAGMFLDQALETVKEHITHTHTKTILKDCYTVVVRGMSFADGLRLHTSYFDPITIMLVHTGHTAGSLAQTLSLLADYLTQQQTFKVKLRSACMMPLVTLLFFLGISTILIFFLIPFYADIFKSIRQPLPISTQWLLSIKNTLSHPYALGLTMMIITLLGIIHRYAINPGIVQRITHSMFYAIPGIKNLKKTTTIIHAMKALSLLTRNGVHVSIALQTLVDAFSSTIFAHHFVRIKQAFDSGQSLSQAFKKENILHMQAIHLLDVGQKSGSFPLIFEKIAQLYQDSLDRRLHSIRIITQPLLMLILSLVIVALIICVYVPLLNFSDTIA